MPISQWQPNHRHGEGIRHGSYRQLAHCSSAFSEGIRRRGPFGGSPTCLGGRSLGTSRSRVFSSSQAPGAVRCLVRHPDGLFRRTSYTNLVEKLREGWWAEESWGPGTPSSSAITKARDRLGVEPLRDLYEHSAAQWAAGSTGLVVHGMRVFAVDGSTFKIPDSTENREHFGKPGTSRGEASYPQLRRVGLMDGRWNLASVAVIARRIVCRCSAERRSATTSSMAASRPSTSGFAARASRTRSCDWPGAIASTASSSICREGLRTSTALSTEMLSGSVEDVRRDARQRIEIGKPGGGYILSTACSVAPATPPENLEALVEVTEESWRVSERARPQARR